MTNVFINIFYNKKNDGFIFTMTFLFNAFLLHTIILLVEDLRKFEGLMIDIFRLG